MSVLGISADYHDSAAGIVVEGRVVAAAAEERFTRVKHDASLPVHAARFCLDWTGHGGDDVEAVAFYDKPFTTFERIVVTHAGVGPRGFRSLRDATVLWCRRKLWVRHRIEAMMHGLTGVPSPRIHFAEHHQSHAASAFYPSPFERAAILTFDGVGEWATTSIAVGEGNRIRMLEELRFPDSVGLLYSTLTAFCGFEVNDGEYKLMGLAPYGEPRYRDVLLDRVVEVADDGSIRLDQRWFDYRAGQRMGSARLPEILDGPPRTPEGPLTQREADIARSIQEVLVLIVMRIAHHAHELTGARTACLAGGVALNCVANEVLLRDGPFDDVWIQPAAGDDGGSIGAALWTWHQILRRERTCAPDADGMSGCALGPQFQRAEIAAWLQGIGVPHDTPRDPCEAVAEELGGGRTVGWFSGRMEFGPRALGHRSILADPRDASMVHRINAAVKMREGFRPFAPAVLAEHAESWFDVDRPLPYMLVTAPVHPSRRRAPTTDAAGEDFASRLSAVNSEIPACTHLDNSARVQTVDRSTNPEFHSVLSAFHRRTGCPVLLNTSFNRRGEPIVNTPADALRCFARTRLDTLSLEGLFVLREALDSSGWRP